MSLIDWINPFSKALDIVDKAVPDKDLAAQLKTEIETGSQKLVEMAENSYRKELDTKTVPWVDALHKMGRLLTSWMGYGLALYMVSENYDPMAVMAACAPGGVYAYVKGKGK